MTSSFEINLVNGLAGDPAVCLYFRQSGESLLFDAGNLEAMSNRELLKIRVVAISHTHIDHFIGFDRLIRVNVPHFRTLEVVGPEGITSNIQGKLSGYTWNLLEANQVNFLVHEIKRTGVVETALLSNSNNFCASDTLIKSPDSKSQQAIKVPLRNNGYELHAVYVDHGTPVLAYQLIMPDTLTVNKTELQSIGLNPGGWISQLQKMASQNQFNDALEIEGKWIDPKALASQLLQRKAGERLMYVTDMIFSAENIDQLKKLAGPGPDVMICEANYRHEHRSRAHDKFHLTTTQAALAAALVRAHRLQIFHISNVYGGENEASVLESQSAFTRLVELDVKLLAEEASKEFVSLG